MDNDRNALGTAEAENSSVLREANDACSLARKGERANVYNIFLFNGNNFIFDCNPRWHVCTCHPHYKFSLLIVFNT